MRAPEKLPPLADLETIWKDCSKCSPGQRQKVLRASQDFRTTTGIADLQEITPAVVVGYQDAVHLRGVSPKQQGHLFQGIKTFLRFIRKRAIAVDTISRALDSMVILSADKTTTVNPMPIKRAEWDALRSVATGEDLAMILLMLNGAYYLQEVIALEWSDIFDNALRRTVKRRVA